MTPARGARRYMSSRWRRRVSHMAPLAAAMARIRGRVQYKERQKGESQPGKKMSPRVIEVASGLV